MSNRRRPALIVPLESRRLLAAASIVLGSDGRLFTTMGDGGQQLFITVSGSNIHVNLMQGDAVVKSGDYASKSVKSIAVLGGSGSDLVKLTNDIKQPAVIGGSDGNDTLIGGGGNDYLAGTGGDDVLDGGAGSDTFVGGGGYDVVDYSSRTKPITVAQNAIADDGEKGEKDDVQGSISEIRGGSGNDVLHAGYSDGAEVTTHGTKLVGNGGNDSLYGSSRADTLFGGSGNDYIDGAKGNDSIQGNAGADKLIGGDGNDTIDGGSGKDSIYGGAGNDSLYGSADRDVFYIHDGSKDTVDGGSGADVVKDKKDGADVLISIVT